MHRIGFGALPLTGVWDGPSDRRAAAELLQRAVARGIGLIDTAGSYAAGANEVLIAEALYPYPPGLVVATKGGVIRTSVERWVKACRPDQLRSACESSLRRLRLQRLELYQLHTIDPEVPFAESIGALAQLRQEGKIRHIGLSNATIEHVMEACAVVPIASVQNRYNLRERQADDLMRWCAARGIAFLPWQPLGGGRLTSDSVAAEIARRHCATPAQVALAWLLQRALIVLPIPGTASLAHLEENIGAGRIVLSDAEISLLDACGGAAPKP